MTVEVATFLLLDTRVLTTNKVLTHGGGLWEAVRSGGCDVCEVCSV